MRVKDISPRLSVVMSVYNNCQELPRALDSILGQTFNDFELVAVNDGSTDGSGQLLERYVRADGRIKVLHQDNKGLTASLNTACAAACGKYLIRHDADDLSAPERFAAQIDYMDSRPEVVLAGTWICMTHPASGPQFLWKMPDDSNTLKAWLNRGFNPFIHGSTIFRRQIFEKLAPGYRFGNSCQDIDLWMRMSGLGEFGVVPIVGYFYTSSLGSIGYATYHARKEINKLLLRLHRERLQHGTELTLDPEEIEKGILKRFESISSPAPIADYADGITALRRRDYETYRSCMQRAASTRGPLSRKAKLHKLMRFCPQLAGAVYWLLDWNSPRRYYCPCPPGYQLPGFPSLIHDQRREI